MFYAVGGWRREVREAEANYVIPAIDRIARVGLGAELLTPRSVARSAGSSTLTVAPECAALEPAITWSRQPAFLLWEAGAPVRLDPSLFGSGCRPPAAGPEPG